jgi:hypothetical protein
MSLMPLAFASLLGGMVTLIGTPPNLIIATFPRPRGRRALRHVRFRARRRRGGVGRSGLYRAGRLAAAAGRPPRRRRRYARHRRLYRRARVEKDGKAWDKSLADIEAMGEGEVRIAGLVRGKKKRMVPPPTERVQARDVLIVEGEPDAIKDLIDAAGLELLDSEGLDTDRLRSKTSKLWRPSSSPARGSPARRRHRRACAGLTASICLPSPATASGSSSAWATRACRSATCCCFRARRTPSTTASPSSAACRWPTALADRPPAPAPVGRRHLRAGHRLTMAGLVPVHVAFATAATVVVVAGIVRPGEIYDSIDWPVIVLLGAMIPVGAALETTGAAPRLVADAIASVGRDLAPMWTVALLLIATMFLSDAINNNATAVLMAPIGIGIARGLQSSPDPFLMAIAVGASCAFLTPIGHQSNTLVMAPGGYRFGDYWRMGLPLEVDHRRRGGADDPAGVAAVRWNGYLAPVFQTDLSHVTFAIAALFVLGWLGMAKEIFIASRQLNLAKAAPQPAGEAERDKDLAKVEWLASVSEWLVGLGLVGTVIGFIIALSSVDQSTLLQTSGAQSAVATLMAGMRTALNTTVLGASLALWHEVNQRMLRTALAVYWADRMAAVPQAQG